LGRHNAIIPQVIPISNATSQHTIAKLFDSSSEYPVQLKDAIISAPKAVAEIIPCTRAGILSDALMLSVRLGLMPPVKHHPQFKVA
jgi:hypothetical protein